ncbi:MAG: spore protease YyaC [Firmicutes bacterium]|nr:spore protease YyaC [Bacillota bacterium]
MIEDFKKKLKSMILNRSVAIVCVGTDLLSGDCLGPLVGQFLVEMNVNAFVYGTLSTPINALNVDRANEFVLSRHRERLIIAVDSAVGKNVGQIAVKNGSIAPGAADGKVLKPIGDISITATTSSALPSEKDFSLVPLGLIYMLARRITEGICFAIGAAE